jgi:hypothetical protein
MNLTMGRDPERFGHIRLFEAWANEARTLVWVYEETPPAAVHRVVVYDDRYQPIRLDGLSGAGAAPLVPALAATPDEPGFVPTQPRNSASTPRPTYRPWRTPRPLRTPQPYYGPGVPTPAPVFTPTRRPPTPTVRPTPRPTRTLAPAPTIRH